MKGLTVGLTLSRRSAPDIAKGTESTVVQTAEVNNHKAYKTLIRSSNK